MPPIFVDARDLAERLGVRYDTVLTWVRRGKLPHIRKGRGRYLFNLNTVLETLRQKSLDARHEAAERDGVPMRPAPRRKPAVHGPGPSGWPLPILRMWTRPTRPRIRAPRPDPRGVPPEARPCPLVSVVRPRPRPLRRARTRSNPTGERSACSRTCTQVKALRPNGKRSGRLPSWRTPQRHARLMTFVIL